MEEKMKKAILLYVVGIILLGTGCQSTRRLNMYCPELYEQYNKTGTESIIGQAFMRKMQGDVVYGAGSTISLMPVTAYTTEIMNKEIRGGLILTPPRSPALSILTTQADGEGNFKFENLAAGDYYVYGDVVWYAGDEKQGGTIVKQVELGSGEREKVMLTR